MNPETRFKISFKKKLEALFPEGFFFKSNDRTTRGIPDVLSCIEGNFVAFELKVGKNVADGLQRWTLAKINLAGGFGRIVYPDSADAILKELQQWVDQKRNNQQPDRG